jgi:hypothetical protein
MNAKAGRRLDRTRYPRPPNFSFSPVSSETTSLWPGSPSGIGVPRSSRNFTRMRTIKLGRKPDLSLDHVFTLTVLRECTRLHELKQPCLLRQHLIALGRQA